MQLECKNKTASGVVSNFAGFVLAELGFFWVVLHLRLGRCFLNTGIDICDFQKVAFKKIGNIFVCLLLFINKVQAIE